jgi:carbamoyl-phosphate synthase large subunit
VLTLNGIDSEPVIKHTVGQEMRAASAAEGTVSDVTTVVDLIEAGMINLVINIPYGRGARSDGYEIRRAALRQGIPTMTNASAAHAAVQAIAGGRRRGTPSVICLQELHPQSQGGEN